MSGNLAKLWSRKAFVLCSEKPQFLGYLCKISQAHDIATWYVQFWSSKCCFNHLIITVNRSFYRSIKSFTGVPAFFQDDRKSTKTTQIETKCGNKNHEIAFIRHELNALIVSRRSRIIKLISNQALHHWKCFAYAKVWYLSQSVRHARWIISFLQLRKKCGENCNAHGRINIL